MLISAASSRPVTWKRPQKIPNMNAVHERHLSRGVIHVCIVRSVGGDWKFTVKPQSWRYCWKNIFCLLDLNSWHIHFLRDSDFLRDFLDGHNCWDCTTSRRLYARTVLRSRKVSPMFAGRNSLIRPDGCLDMVPSSIFVTIFWETLSKNSEISQKIVKFEAPVVYKCVDLWLTDPQKTFRTHACSTEIESI